ncbi:ABC transporter ATP-binding protein [Tuberibacillus sp. Marseille-P3662]|uniref:ABC transporter ATP-binding protein n=1 Tax=Tuberibacillus sp. Marseille-P3662 TaxID=1965358 RepID=UPI000A1C9A93|nr:ABC transporter ATP-binding protein [Tuberibacillus sp. Marseille-P3662]
MAEPVIQLENVKKNIGGKTIIHGLSFDIYPGEVFGFLGPNGAGKTTTIRMMVGLMKLTEGDVIIKGKSIKTNFQDAISQVGGIVENPEMYKFLSGWKNLVHYARMVPGVTKERMKEVVQLVGLEKRINEKVGKYSLGMRQRLGLAQALLHKPSVLILDEPTNGLDPAGIREIRNYIRRLAQEEGLSVIVSSHLLSEMELMCDRIGILQNGKLIGVQAMNDFVNDETTVQVRLSLEPDEQAKTILEQELDLTVQVEDDAFTIHTERERIPDIVKQLVDNDIKVFGVNVTSGTLEDRFLEVTGGEGIE